MCCEPDTLLWFALSVFRSADIIGIDGHVSFLHQNEGEKGLIVLSLMPWRSNFPCHRMCCGPDTLLSLTLCVFRIADMIGIDGHVSFIPHEKYKDWTGEHDMAEAGKLALASMVRTGMRLWIISADVPEKALQETACHAAGAML